MIKPRGRSERHWGHGLVGALAETAKYCFTDDLQQCVAYGILFLLHVSHFVFMQTNVEIQIT